MRFLVKLNEMKQQKGVLETNLGHVTPICRVCFAWFDWNVSENAVYIKSAWVVYLLWGPV